MSATTSTHTSSALILHIRNYPPQEPECPARHEGAAGQSSAVTRLPLTLPCRNLHPDRSRSCHDVRGIPGMLRRYSGVSVSSGNGKRHKALEVTWHPDLPAGQHMAVLPLLGSFPTGRTGRMCEHVGGTRILRDSSSVICEPPPCFYLSPWSGCLTKHPLSPLSFLVSPTASHLTPFQGCL